MLRPFWITSAKSRLKTARASTRDIEGYAPIFFLVRLPSRHCWAIQSAVTRLGIGLRTRTRRPVPRPSPSARFSCFWLTSTRLSACRMAVSVRLGIAILLFRNWDRFRRNRGRLLGAESRFLPLKPPPVCQNRPHYAMPKMPEFASVSACLCVLQRDLIDRVGWLCTRMTALAESSSARRMTSRG